MHEDFNTYQVRDQAGATHLLDSVLRRLGLLFSVDTGLLVSFQVQCPQPVESSILTSEHTTREC